MCKNKRIKKLALTIKGLGWYVIDDISDNNSLVTSDDAAKCKGVDIFSLSLETITSASGSPQQPSNLVATSCGLKHAWTLNEHGTLHKDVIYRVLLKNVPRQKMQCLSSCWIFYYKTLYDYSRRSTALLLHIFIKFCWFI